MLINTILIFIIGCFIGSFLNLVSDRILTGSKIVVGRSKCDACGKALRPKNLIPILSFIIQKGRCSNCKSKISWYYPLSEVLSGLFFVLSSQVTSFNIFEMFEKFSALSLIGFLFMVTIFSVYEVLLLTDLKFLIIPDKIVLPAIGFVALFNIGINVFNLFEYRRVLENDDFGKYLIKVGYFNDQVIAIAKQVGVNFLSALLIGLFFFLLVWATKGRGMGGGDIRLSVLVGLVNSFPYNLIAIFFGFFTGAVVSVFLIILKRKTLKSIVPFGPFLIFGSIVCILWGQQILNWYLHLL